MLEFDHRASVSELAFVKLIHSLYPAAGDSGGGISGFETIAIILCGLYAEGTIPKTVCELLLDIRSFEATISDDSACDPLLNTRQTGGKDWGALAKEEITEIKGILQGLISGNSEDHFPNITQSQRPRTDFASLRKRIVKTMRDEGKHSRKLEGLLRNMESALRHAELLQEFNLCSLCNNGSDYNPDEEEGHHFASLKIGEQFRCNSCARMNTKTRKTESFLVLSPTLIPTTLACTLPEFADEFRRITDHDPSAVSNVGIGSFIDSKLFGNMKGQPVMTRMFKEKETVVDPDLRYFERFRRQYPSTFNIRPVPHIWIPSILQTDGYQPYRSSSYSLWPMWVRYLPISNSSLNAEKLCSMMTILPSFCSTKDVTMLSSEDGVVAPLHTVLAPVIDKLAQVERNGFYVINCVSGQVEIAHIVTIGIGSDYQGAVKMGGYSGSSSHSQCFYCDIFNGWKGNHVLSSDKYRHVLKFDGDDEKVRMKISDQTVKYDIDQVKAETTTQVLEELRRSGLLNCSQNQRHIVSFQRLNNGIVLTFAGDSDLCDSRPLTSNIERAFHDPDVRFIMGQQECQYVLQTGPPKDWRFRRYSTHCLSEGRGWDSLSSLFGYSQVPSPLLTFNFAMQMSDTPLLLDLFHMFHENIMPYLLDLILDGSPTLIDLGVSLTFDELRSLSIGSWSSPNAFGEPFSEVTIPKMFIGKLQKKNYKVRSGGTSLEGRLPDLQPISVDERCTRMRLSNEKSLGSKLKKLSMKGESNAHLFKILRSLLPFSSLKQTPIAILIDVISEIFDMVSKFQISEADLSRLKRLEIIAVFIHDVNIEPITSKGSVYFHMLVHLHELIKNVGPMRGYNGAWVERQVGLQKKRNSGTTFKVGKSSMRRTALQQTMTLVIGLLHGVDNIYISVAHDVDNASSAISGISIADDTLLAKPTKQKTQHKALLLRQLKSKLISEVNNAGTLGLNKKKRDLLYEMLIVGSDHKRQRCSDNDVLPFWGKTDDAPTKYIGELFTKGYLSPPSNGQSSSSIDTVILPNVENVGAAGSNLKQLKLKSTENNDNITIAIVRDIMPFIKNKFHLPHLDPHQQIHVEEEGSSGFKETVSLLKRQQLDQAIRFRGVISGKETATGVEFEDKYVEEIFKVPFDPLSKYNTQTTVFVRLREAFDSTNGKFIKHTSQNPLLSTFVIQKSLNFKTTHKSRASQKSTTVHFGILLVEQETLDETGAYFPGDDPSISHSTWNTPVRAKQTSSNIARTSKWRFALIDQDAILCLAGKFVFNKTVFFYFKDPIIVRLLNGELKETTVEESGHSTTQDDDIVVDTIQSNCVDEGSSDSNIATGLNPSSL